MAPDEPASSEDICARLEMARDPLWAIADSEHYHVGPDGKVVTMLMDGEEKPVWDDWPRLRACEELRRNLRLEAMIRGYLGRQN